MVILTIIMFNGPELFGVPTSIHNPMWSEENGVHFTLFFDIFVFLQLFNEINCRKLKKEEVNVFAGFFENSLFIFVIVVTIVV